MSRWFRHYAGMMRDEKLVRAAIQSKQPVERVVWVWGAILESASEVNDGGRFDFDAGEAAYFLRVDEGDIQNILSALVSLGRISEGSVVRWSDRQFESDQSKDRQKRYRERIKASRDGGVTSRDVTVTAQETDTETEDTSSLRSDVRPEPEKSAPASPTAIELPALKGEMVSITEADVAEWSEAFPAVNVRQQLAAMRSWLNANPGNRKTTKGMKRFVVSWLSRDQDRGGGRQQPQAQAPPRPMSPHMQRQHDIHQKLKRDLYGEPDDEFAGQTVDLGAGDFRSH